MIHRTRYYRAMGPAATAAAASDSHDGEVFESLKAAGRHADSAEFSFVEIALLRVVVFNDVTVLNVRIALFDVNHTAALARAA
jgi:hypothetical protein